MLPFTNLSGDPSQDYFADGITENLTTDLSRIRNSFVIARNTAFTFKGKNIDTKEIGKQLGVRYVLEGSVQRDQNRVRVNAQLIDGETSAHLWADRFEDDLADLFKLQDQVVARLANTLGYELVKAEANKSAHSTNPDAIDLQDARLGTWSNVPGRDKAQHQQARDLFERVLQIDPQNVEAMVGVALIDIRPSAHPWSSNTAISFFSSAQPGLPGGFPRRRSNAAARKSIRDLGTWPWYWSLETLGGDPEIAYLTVAGAAGYAVGISLSSRLQAAGGPARRRGGLSLAR